MSSVVEEYAPSGANAHPSDLTAAGVAAMLQAHLNELRSIKNAEAGWLDRFTVLTVPSIVILVSASDSFTLALLVGIAFSYFALTAWLQDILRKERRSYYRVARSTVRAQNYLGLFSVNILPQAFADPFPLGMGANPDRDGTQPLSSFARRQAYSFLMFAILLAALAFHDVRIAPLAGLLSSGDVCWILWLFRQDARTMSNESLAERHLTGNSPEWFTMIDRSNPL